VVAEWYHVGFGVGLMSTGKIVTLDGQEVEFTEWPLRIGLKGGHIEIAEDGSFAVRVGDEQPAPNGAFASIERRMHAHNAIVDAALKGAR
jgi:hypothetical protein